MKPLYLTSRTKVKIFVSFWHSWLQNIWWA